MPDPTTLGHTDEHPPDLATRRCWRCLQMFPEDADRGPHPDEWWVCEPCSDALLPSKRRRS